MYIIRSYFPFKVISPVLYLRDDELFDNLILAQQKQRVMKLAYYNNRLNNALPKEKKGIYKKIKQIKKSCNKCVNYIEEHPEMFI